MKKIITALLICLSIVGCLFVDIFADTTPVDLAITITKNADNYQVDIPNNDIFSTKEPTIKVITTYSKAKVLKGTEEIASSISNGEVSFKITEGGTYYITEVVSPSPSPSPKYIIPNTGVE